MGRSLYFLFYFNIDSALKEIAKFGRIDATMDPGALEFIPFKIQAFPSVVTYTPTGEFDLLPYTTGFNPSEVESAAIEILSKAVSTVSAESAKEFLKLSPTYYQPGVFSRFNFLLLRKRHEIPRPYLKNAMVNLGIISFAVAEPQDRHDILKKLDVDSSTNLLFSYAKFNEKGEPKNIIESKSASLTELNAIIDLAAKHTIIGKKKIKIYH